MISQENRQKRNFNTDACRDVGPGLHRPVCNGPVGTGPATYLKEALEVFDWIVAAENQFKTKSMKFSSSFSVINSNPSGSQHRCNSAGRSPHGGSHRLGKNILEQSGKFASFLASIEADSRVENQRLGGWPASAVRLIGDQRIQRIPASNEL
ncbi:hypothetical protein Pla52o_55110 [Novipirellula galeiformis]|uniref:Uncharacterized protein n=1 Tax=Novipirellula galeiformis TaxID=2528004 RepID=A0A5C6BW63_9BACT|nr:hypothetical protein Pla52o_55110 [Novipirellula galeiformis]